MAQQSRQDQILIYCLLLLVCSSKITQTHQSHPCLGSQEALEGGPWRAVERLTSQTWFVSLTQLPVQSEYTEGSVPLPDPRHLWAQPVLSCAQGEPAGLLRLPTTITGRDRPFLSGMYPAQTRERGIPSPGDT